MAKSYDFLLGTSGVGLSRAAQKISDVLGSAKVGIFDIESTLCGLAKTSELLSRHMKVVGVPRMYDVTYYLTRTELGELWRISANECLNHVAQSTKDINIIAGHVTYYGAQRKEFYSVIDSILLRKTLSVSSVALLTDDIYDMYIRLIGDKELFDETTSIPEYLDRISDEREIQVRALSHLDQATLIMQWQKNTLLTILAWRSLETILAENLAIQLNSKFMLWAVKQRIDAYIKWIFNSRSIYLSHPISEARRRINNIDEWNGFTSQVNKVQEIGLKQGLVCMMPTAIDEFRFQASESRVRGEKKSFNQKKKIADLNNKHWTGFLLKRWPVPPFSKILYVPPSNSEFPNYRTILLPRIWNYKKIHLELLGKSFDPKVEI